MMAKVIQVIETAVTRGCGHSDFRPCDSARFEKDHRHEPIRTVTQYFDFQGKLLAEHDPSTEPVVRVRAELLRSAT